MITLKSITEILPYKFFVPSYQRGYRWEDSQVIDLLEDIWEFTNVPSKAEGEFYCLQPVIVKYNEENNHYIVIDGQQRLTTIYIILSYFDDIIKVMDNDFKLFTIQYQTRPDSQLFLESIKDIDEINEKNIDYYYISNAYLKIDEWVKEKKINKLDFVNSLLRHNPKDNSKFDVSNNVRFIWYELDKYATEIDVFTRINSGKIPLTNAELIKALFLNRKNFDTDELSLKQIEIAKEWDEIEFMLQINEFWNFIAYDRNFSTRIELIFEILSNETNTNSVYRYFANQANQKDIVKLWSETQENIKKIFLSLRYWFDNRRLYHLIGFIIATNIKDVNELYDVFKENTKSEFVTYLKSLINDNISINEIEELDYDYDRNEIQNILLLFNIATILNNKESYIRFAFDIFNSEQWSLEHIHARQDKGLKTSEEIKNWLNDILQILKKVSNNKKKQKEKLIININEILSNDKIDREDNSFLSLQTDIFEFFGNPDIDTIDNLALLSKNINSSLSNNVFPIKRDIIINKDKEGEFIPICTKNVFLKYYTKNANNLFFWNNTDRKAYLKEIKSVLKSF